MFKTTRIMVDEVTNRKLDLMVSGRRRKHADAIRKLILDADPEDFAAYGVPRRLEFLPGEKRWTRTLRLDEKTHEKLVRLSRGGSLGATVRMLVMSAEGVIYEPYN